MTMLPRYLDRLDPERQEVFKKLKAFSDEFILAGGTAIMLQIGHRQSYDFDCFTEKDLSKNLLKKIIKIFGSTFSIELQTSEMITIQTKSKVDISFVWHPYQPLKKPVKTDSLSLFHLDDLVTNKALTIGRRGAWRDYVDLFFFLKWKLYNIKKIIQLSDQRFRPEFNDKLFLQQLVYFDDLKLVPTNFIKESYSHIKIKSFLEKQVRDYLKKRLKI